MSRLTDQQEIEVDSLFAIPPEIHFCEVSTERHYHNESPMTDDNYQETPDWAFGVDPEDN